MYRFFSVTPFLPDIWIWGLSTLLFIGASYRFFSVAILAVMLVLCALLYQSLFLFVIGLSWILLILLFIPEVRDRRSFFLLMALFPTLLFLPEPLNEYPLIIPLVFMVPLFSRRNVGFLALFFCVAMGLILGFLLGEDHLSGLRTANAEYSLIHPLIAVDPKFYDFSWIRLSLRADAFVEMKQLFQDLILRMSRSPLLLLQLLAWPIAAAVLEYGRSWARDMRKNGIIFFSGTIATALLCGIVYLIERLANDRALMEHLSVTAIFSALCVIFFCGFQEKRLRGKDIPKEYSVK